MSDSTAMFQTVEKHGRLRTVNGRGTPIDELWHGRCCLICESHLSAKENTFCNICKYQNRRTCMYGQCENKAVYQAIEPEQYVGMTLCMEHAYINPDLRLSQLEGAWI